MLKKFLKAKLLFNLHKNRNEPMNKRTISIELNCEKETSLSVPSKKIRYDIKEIPSTLEKI
jgi:hypothetical protein